MIDCGLYKRGVKRDEGRDGWKNSVKFIKAIIEFVKSDFDET